VDPRKQIGSLCRKQAAALFLIEKNYGPRGKSFSPRRPGCRSSIGAAQPRSIPRRFDLGVTAAIEKNKEAKAGRFKHPSLSKPGISLAPRRIIQPIAGIRKGLAQSLQVCVAGIIIPVKADISG